VAAAVAAVAPKNLEFGEEEWVPLRLVLDSNLRLCAFTRPWISILYCKHSTASLNISRSELPGQGSGWALAGGAGGQGGPGVLLVAQKVLQQQVGRVRLEAWHHVPASAHSGVANVALPLHNLPCHHLWAALAKGPGAPGLANGKVQAKRDALGLYGGDGGVRLAAVRGGGGVQCVCGGQVRGELPSADWGGSRAQRRARARTHTHL